MPRSTLRVLVVDDDEDDFLIIRDLLADAPAADYRAEWADSLPAGLRALRDGDFDVCLVDQRLGPDRGVDLIRTASWEDLATPAILLTGATSRELDEEALAAGAWDYLVKGTFDAELLSRSIRYAVEGARSLRRLEASERRYRLLFEKNPGPMWIYDPETLAFLDVNQAATREYGYTREEFLGMTLLDVRPDDDRDAVLALVGQGEPGYRAVGIWRHRRKDGSIRYVDVIRHDIEFAGRRARIALPRDVTAQVEAQKALEAAHAQHRRLLEDTVDAIVVVDDFGLVQFANAAAESLFGSGPGRLRGECLPHADALMRKHGSEVEIRREDGRLKVVEPRVTETQWDGQRARLVVLRDQTDLQRHRRQLALLERAIESTINGVVICDAGSDNLPLIYANPAFERITGYDIAEAVGRNMRFLQGNDRDQPAIAEMRAALAAREECEVVLRNHRKDGRPFWNQLSISPVRDALGQVTHFIGIQNDITERVQAEEALVHAETHDAVTGLLRYPLFAARMAATLAEFTADDEPLSLFFIDLDRFHAVNESLGHAVGDVTLYEVAERIRDVLGSAAEMTRYAGDEFLAVVRGKSMVEALALAERIREAICRPIEGDEYRVYVTASIGLSRFPEHGRGWAELLRRAELAMGQAKRQGRDQVMPFSVEQMVELESRLELGGHLREALRANEFRLNFQPIYRLRPHRLAGFEALLRWRSATLGEVPPNRFIPVAESLGLMPEIGRWVLEEGCRQARAWLDAGHAGFTVSVNVSALQLLRTEFVPDLARVLERHRIPRGMLDIELTESVLMEQVEQTRDTLHALKALGVSISLDDFGTGYSSLAYLRNLPLDKLKIDRSFVKDLPDNEGAVAITRSIVGIAHELRLQVCAEGVETEAQHAFLARCECDQSQGYLFGRPMPPEQAIELLAHDAEIS